jgi:hypothetical protein
MNKWHRRHTDAAATAQASGAAPKPTDSPAPPVAVLPDQPAESTSEAQPEEGGLHVAHRRAGYQPVMDSAGAEVARIRGDYVVGFTTEIQGRQRWFEDLDGAIAAVADEVRTAREAATTQARSGHAASA